jgi:DNA-binding transcriptional LysR family regulator
LGRAGARDLARREQQMTATQLRAFLALADAGSFVSASGATGLSQPTLHRAVRDLEHLAGTVLVERRGRGVVLTGNGRQLARGVRLAAGEISAAIAETRPDRAEGGGSITIGAMPLSRAVLLPAAIAELTRVSPRTSVDVVEGSWRELVEPLRDGILDMMIGALRDTPPADLVQKPLFEDRLVVVAGVRHPLVGRHDVTLDDLARFPWIVGRDGAPLRAQWEALFEGRPLPSAPIECGSVMTIRGILRSTHFLTLLSPDQIALELSSGLLATIGEPLERNVRVIGVTTRAAWRPTTAQARFIALVESVIIPKIG